MKIEHTLKDLTMTTVTRNYYQTKIRSPIYVCIFKRDTPTKILIKDFL